MTKVTAEAPGKVVLCGEYAVLDGAPAISMAVDRRARAVVDDIEAQWHRVSAPGYSVVEGRFVGDSASVKWLQGKNEFELVEAVFRESNTVPDKYLSIELDTREFCDTTSGEKIGLGSSAALAVALAAALRGSDDVLLDAMRAHRGFQQGAGSGVDIATCVSGGLVEYRMAGAQITPLQWPTGLVFRLVWTGVAASTRSKLDKLGAAGQRESRQQLAESAESMAIAWRSTSALLREYPEYIERLRRFSVDYDLGIFDAGHDELVNEAQDAGLVYKPCGAGGGDVGILLGTSDAELDEFVAGRCRSIECNLDVRGVKLEQR